MTTPKENFEISMGLGCITTIASFTLTGLTTASIAWINEATLLKGIGWAFITGLTAAITLGPLTTRLTYKTMTRKPQEEKKKEPHPTNPIRHYGEKDTNTYNQYDGKHGKHNKT